MSPPRIEKYYRRSARVIHSPRGRRALRQPGRDDRGYYLSAGRVVPYKRVPVAVAACERLGRPLKVVGTGRGMDAVRAVAGPHTELLGHVGDDELSDLVAGARALLFPGEEDFGIVPVEVQGRGGARDRLRSWRRP